MKLNTRNVLHFFIFLIFILMIIEPVFSSQYNINEYLFYNFEEQLDLQYSYSGINNDLDNGTNGPLGEWPDFTPIGYITAPHPDNPDIQTYLYGDWGAIVGEEFIFLQDGLIKLLYHSYHETYLTQRTHEEFILDNWTLGYDPVTKIKLPPLAQPGGPIPGPGANPDRVDAGQFRHL